MSNNNKPASGDLERVVVPLAPGYVVTLRDDRASEKFKHGISRGVPNNLEYALACEVRDLRKMLSARPATTVESDRPVPVSPHCQKCGGEIQGWTCQSCPAEFKENDAGNLVLCRDEDFAPVAEEVVREAIVTAIAFLKRDLDTPRINDTVVSLLPKLVEADAALRGDR